MRSNQAEGNSEYEECLSKLRVLEIEKVQKEEQIIDLKGKMDEKDMEM